MKKLSLLLLTFVVTCFSCVAEVPADNVEESDSTYYYLSEGEAYFDEIGQPYPLVNIYEDVEDEAYDSIIANVEKVLAVVPDDTLAKYYRGLALFLQKKYREAIPDLMLAWETDTEDVSFSSPYEILNSIGKHEPDLLINLLERKGKELDQSPQNAEKLYGIYMLLGSISINTGHSRLAAETYYPKAATFAPDSSHLWSAYLSSSTGWLRSGHPDKVLEILESPVLDSLPLINKYPNKMLALRNLGRIDEALRLLDGLLELYPDYEEILMNKGTLLSAVKRYDEAIMCFDKVIDSLNIPETFFIPHRHTLLAEAYLRRGIAHEFKGEMSKAEENFNSVLHLEAQGHYISALAHLKRKDDLENMINLYGLELDALPLTVIYTQLDDYDKAFTYLKEAFRLQDVSPQALKYDPNLLPLLNDTRYNEAVKSFDPSK